MRKVVLAVATAVAMVCASPAISQRPAYDATKFYMHFPIVAEGHDKAKPQFYVPMAFDTLAECDQFRSVDWFQDKVFVKNISGRANEELEAHDGDVEFLPSYCWRPADGLRDGPKA